MEVRVANSTEARPECLRADELPLKEAVETLSHGTATHLYREPTDDDVVLAMG
jgi:hypothetical protein